MSSIRESLFDLLCLVSLQAMRKMRDAIKSKKATALSEFRNMQKLEDMLEQAQVRSFAVQSIKHANACILIILSSDLHILIASGF